MANPFPQAKLIEMRFYSVQFKRKTKIGCQQQRKPHPHFSHDPNYISITSYYGFNIILLMLKNILFMEV